MVNETAKHSLYISSAYYEGEENARLARYVWILKGNQLSACLYARFIHKFGRMRNYFIPYNGAISSNVFRRGTAIIDNLDLEEVLHG